MANGQERRPPAPASSGARGAEGCHRKEEAEHLIPSRADSRNPVARLLAPRPTRDQLDFESINRAALAVLPDLLHRWAPGGAVRGAEYVARNPRRADRHVGSFSVNLRTGRWADFATTDKGRDVISLFAYLGDARQVEAAKWLAAKLGLRGAGAVKEIARPPAVQAEGDPERLVAGDDQRRRQEMALRLWKKATAPAGTPVEPYLRGRGLPVPVDDVVRFHPACPCGTDRIPAMVALLKDIHTAEPVGVHRTFLQLDVSGSVSKVADRQAKMMLGRAAGAVIALTAHDEVTAGLGIAEGIENGLTALAAGWAPVWAAGSAGAVADFPVLNGIETLTIFADRGPAGEDAARDCASRWAAAGREARVLIPCAADDWNDAIVRRAVNG